MRILVSGATGLVGQAFAAVASQAGDQVVSLTRHPRQAEDVGWDPAQGKLERIRLEGFDAVVHLAGENIASGRWNAARKRQIRESRVQGTRLLSESLASLDHRPRVLVSASAIGFYGSRGDERLTESSTAGQLFLSDVCREWEQATAPAAAVGIRVVHARFGVILSTLGGALAKMLTPFRLGVGGIVGNGQQFWSWISLHDVARALAFAVHHDSLVGAVNVVAPHAVTNYEFTKSLGRILHRPTILPMPAFAARLALGEMADELLLASARVEPAKLVQAGFGFDQPRLEQALQQLLAT